MTENLAKEQEPTAALMRLDPQALIQTALEQNADIEKLERLFDLAMKLRAEVQRAAWYGAMAEFQKRCPAPKKDRTANAGSFTFKYATLQEWMRAILPTMGDCGLAVSFETAQQPDSFSARCVIMHAMGHAEKSGTITMPIPKALADGKGPNESMRVGIAQSYAMRNALRSIVGLAPEDGEDEVAGHGAQPGAVRQPSRTGAAPQQAPPAAAKEPSSWVGVVKTVNQRSGTKKGQRDPKGNLLAGQQDTPWTLYTIVGDDGLEFTTFSASDAKFAREAGVSKVRITFTETDRGGLNATSVEPAA